MIITLDPGHGGSDPGACNPITGTRECDIALEVSLKLKTQLEAVGHEVVMTRTEDVDVYGPNASATEELQARCDISDNANSDICISIHCNAFDDPNAHGTETFYYKNSGAGSTLAQYIDSSLIGFCLTGRNTDKSKPLYMTRHPAAVAVLVELAFITNPEEEQILLTRQCELVDAMFNGIQAYFKS